MDTIPVTPDSTLKTDDQTVVSVGPYIFHKPPTRESNSEARSPGKASPPQNAVNWRLPSQPDSINIRHVAGVACITVACETAKRRFSLSTCIASSRDAMTTFPPVIK